MRDIWLVLFTIAFVLGGITTGIMALRRLDEFPSTDLYILLVATVVLFVLARYTWSVTVRTRERDRYSHLSSSDRIEVVHRGVMDEDHLTEGEKARYHREMAEFERAMADRPTEEKHQPIPQHVYDEFAPPGEHYDTSLPPLFPDDPRVLTREWSEETVIIEDEHGRRVYQEKRPKPRWLQKWEENAEDRKAGRPPRHTPPF